MENPDQFVTRAEYARMRGWDRSYVTQLHQAGRLVMSDNDELVDWSASDALVEETADPSKDGVKKRWQEERLQKNVYDAVDFPALSDEGAGVSRADKPAASAFHDARASREHYAGELARLEFEWVSGLLVNRMRVEDAATTMGRHFRDRVMGMASRVAPELAAIIDPWTLEQRLDAELRKMLEDVTVYGETIMRNAMNDPGKGKLSDLSRMGKERYGDSLNTGAS